MQSLILTRVSHVVAALFATIVIASCSQVIGISPVEEAGDPPEIVTFGFAAASNPALATDVTATVAGTAITASVPFGTSMTGLKATFQTTGVSVLVDGVTQISGVTANDFTSSVAYTVIAGDGTSRTYAVTLALGPSPAHELTSFAFQAVHNANLATDVTASIVGTTITATVPTGTIVTSLVATFVSTGAGVAVGAIPQTSGVSANNFTNPVVYRVTAANGSTRDYPVTVVVAPSAANQLTSFALLAAGNPGLSSDVTATIVGTSITATLPFGTDRSALKPTFTTTGATVTVGAVMQVSGTTANDFTNPVIYRVVAADNSTRDYTVTISVAPSTANDLASFAFTMASNPALAADVTATITGTSIAATVPFGTSVNALRASFTTTGASVTVSGTPQLSGTTPNNFASAVVYRVTAADSSTKDYAVTVTIAPSSTKDLTSLGFLAANNPALFVDVTGVITGTSITVSVPFGTNVTALKASFTTTGVMVTVAAVTQVSGVTANNFMNPIVYQVTAADTSTRSYTVTVTVAGSTAKDLTSFRFLTVSNPALTTDVTGVIAGTTITVTVPIGTPRNGLKTTFSTTGASVRVGAVVQVSGVTANNFTSPVVYRVTAADSSTKDYTVTVNEQSAGVSFAPKVDLTAGLSARSVALGDLNGDSRPDLTVVNQGATTVSVFLNTTAVGATTASFAAKVDFTTASGPYSVALADVNTDGRLDLTVANANVNSMSVFLNTTTMGASTPSFAARVDFATGNFPEMLAAADLNGDNRPDIAVANESSDSVSVLLNTTTSGATTPTFAARVDYPAGDAVAIALGDFNGDAKLDVAVANGAEATVSVLLNKMVIGATVPNFSVRTTFLVGGLNTSLAAADLNADGKTDLASAVYGIDAVAVLLGTTTAGGLVPTFAAPVAFATGMSPSSVAISDFDGDSRLDLAVTNAGQSTVSVRRSTTSSNATVPSFATGVSFPTGATPLCVTTGDVNGDGRPDLAVANGNASSASVLLYSAAPPPTPPSYATRTDFATGPVPNAVTTADINGDGKPDLAVTNGNAGTVSVLLDTTATGATTPSFATQVPFSTGFDGSHPSGFTPVAVAAADLNRDGRPDLAVANNLTNSGIAVLLNTTVTAATTPTFASHVDFPAGTAAKSVAISDINQDAIPDLVVTNSDSQDVSVLLGTTTIGATTPTFLPSVELTVGSSPNSVSVGDFNGDGAPDLAVANFTGNVVVLLNTTAVGAMVPTFAAAVSFTAGAATSHVRAGDLNGDGKSDLVVSNNSPNTMAVLLNTTATGAGTPTFAASVPFTQASTPGGLALGDLDGDGRLDVAITAGASTASVFVNTIPTGGATPSFATRRDFTTASSPSAVVLADVNTDGKLDLVVNSQLGNVVSVLLAQ